MNQVSLNIHQSIFSTHLFLNPGVTGFCWSLYTGLATTLALFISLSLFLPPSIFCFFPITPTGQSR